MSAKKTALEKRIEACRSQLNEAMDGASTFLRLHPYLSRHLFFNLTGQFFQSKLVKHRGGHHVTLRMKSPPIEQSPFDFEFKGTLVYASTANSAIQRTFPVTDREALHKFLVEIGFWSAHEAAEAVAAALEKGGRRPCPTSFARS